MHVSNNVSICTIDILPNITEVRLMNLLGASHVPILAEVSLRAFHWNGATASPS